MNLQLTKEKSVELSGWTGSTKKQFINLFKDKGDNVSEKDVMSILVYPFITPSDVYYSEDEIQYILIHLRDLSLTDEIKVETECSNEKCKKDLFQSVNVKELCEYTEGKFPIVDGPITWRELNKRDDVNMTHKQHKEEPYIYVEKYLHIEKYNDEIMTGFQRIMDVLDDIPLKDYNEVSDNYDRNRSKIELGYTFECVCGTETKIEMDSIPDFFNPLLPKEINFGSKKI